MLTKKERLDSDDYRTKINEYKLLIKNHEEFIELLKNKIKKWEVEMDAISNKSRMRRIKKCKHEFASAEYSWTTYYDSCGYNWCGFNDYHKHQHCSKCGYIVDEPLVD